ncbi:MAG: hypothetical protein WDA71_04745 [Actinomycetota bacterium]
MPLPQSERLALPSALNLPDIFIIVRGVIFFITIATDVVVNILMMIMVVVIQMIGVLPNSEFGLACQRIANTPSPTRPYAVAHTRTAHRL